MRALLGIDTSQDREAVIANAMLRRWPEGSALRLVTVVYSAIPAVPDPSFAAAAAQAFSLEQQRNQAPARLREAAERLEEATAVPVSTMAVEGTPSECIVEEARAFGADLILLGARRHGTLREKLLGSTSSRVAAQAPCAVEIARPDDRPLRIAEGVDSR